MKNNTSHIITKNNLKLKQKNNWNALISHIESESSNLKLLNCINKLQKDLSTVGIDPTLIHSIKTGLQTDNWNNAVINFNKSVDGDFNFYLGPMKNEENQPIKMGMILLKKINFLKTIVKKVESNASEIGEKLFGFPCNFHGRYVEFYNIETAAGPFANSSGETIALFTPFYFGGWSDTNNQLMHKRTIIFLNILLTRFKYYTNSFSKNYLTIDGKKPSFLTASTKEIQKSIALWISLHELIHGSGPLPLFNANFHKIPLGMSYGSIEEMRVDMSIWLLLYKFEYLFGPLSKLSREIILAERLFRSCFTALSKYSGTGGIQQNIDGEHGFLWFAFLLNKNALTIKSKNLNVDSSKTTSSIASILTKIYDLESSVSLQPENGEKTLTTFAKDLRNSLFEKSNQKLYVPATIHKYFDSLDGMSLLNLSFKFKDDFVN